MQDNLKKVDKRALKTDKTLMTAMTQLLRRQKFTQITVSSLCKEARISRATFYAHCTDKYDLLKKWLTYIKLEVTNNIESHEAIEAGINNFVNQNSEVIRNLMESASNETAGLLCDFFLSLLDIYTDKTNKQQTDPKYIVLSRFCCGGLMNYLSWQIDNKFPEDLQMMNNYLYDLVMTMLKWYSE